MRWRIGRELESAVAAKRRVQIALVRLTVRSGLLVAAGGPTAGMISPPVAALAAGVTRAMFLTKAKIALLVLLVFGILAGCGGWIHRALAAPRDETRTEPNLME
ncbi:MAG: hypothetical protein JOY72_11990, partial [Actinobacteria bacterium]|nr:hypothetical protein [Actinomycetota bacterium]